jgi:peptidylprolyl isomerase
MPAQSGNTVRVSYTGTLSDGSQFDSSEGHGPLEFTLGSGQVIPGFDEGVTGMEVGESKTITIPSEQAYGPRREEMLLTVPRDQFPEGIDPELGQQLQLGTAGGDTLVATVTEVSDESVVLDANHQLAGEDLTFELKLEEIV